MKNPRVKMTIMLLFVVLVSTGLLLLISYQWASDSLSDQLVYLRDVTFDRHARRVLCNPACHCVCPPFISP